MYCTVTAWFDTNELGRPVTVAPLEDQVIDALFVVEVSVNICPSIEADAAGSVSARLPPVVPLKNV